jgi:lysophospholipase L1-like esterase
MQIPKGFYSTNKQVQTRTAWYCRDNITSVRLVLPNFFVPDAFTSGYFKYTETPLGSIATWTASIEYPSGTFTQVTFQNGATSGKAFTDNSYVVSDVIPVTIPAGALAWVRLFMNNSSGAFFSTDQGTGTSVVQNVALGDACEAAASGLTDKTMGGTITNGAAGNALTPLAILAVSSVPSPFIIGDSKCYGQADTSNANGDAGQIARSIGPSLPYINGGVQGDYASAFVVPKASTNRIDLAKRYFTSVICQYGFNDVHNFNVSVTDTYEALQEIWSNFPNVFQTTISAKTNAANTVPDATNTKSQNLNALIRAIPFGLTSVFDIASMTDNGSLWLQASYTSDGTHESVSGYLTEQNSGVINASVII